MERAGAWPVEAESRVEAALTRDCSRSQQAFAVAWPPTAVHLALSPWPVLLPRNPA